MAKQRWGVIQFPGSNCDGDALKAIAQLEDVEASYHWHEDPIVKNHYQVLIVPGGFSFGDYLRAGAIARLSPAILSLPEAVEAGAHVMGICNGFQILLEARLLPGFLHVNDSLKFVSKNIKVEVSSAAYPWITEKEIGHSLVFPIAHKFGNYQLANQMDKHEMKTVLKYKENPNGSVDSTAGIYRKLGKGSLFGLMPHPERASFQSLQLTDGMCFWKNAVEACR